MSGSALAENTAHASVLIAAPRSAVWRVLLDPATLLKILPVVDVVRAWAPGAAFLWTIEMLGKPYAVEGNVLRIEEPSVVEYTYGDPHAKAFMRIENVHRVTIALTDEGEHTRVAVTQDNNLTSAATEHAAGGWRLALHNLKYVVESART